MARDLFAAGEVMVAVKGNVNSSIASSTQLGVAAAPITWNPVYHRLDVTTNPTGYGPVEIQNMGIEATIQVPLVHFDPAVLNECLRLSANGAAEGQNGHAGARMGNSAARFAANYWFFGLNLTSPVAGLPYRFLHTMLQDNPLSWPVGAERSIVVCNFRAISYVADPWNAGAGLNGIACWDHGADT